ncbi:MAG: MSHA biogenesis protein MshK [Deltaproteobacteria bacterium]|nr:MSHA biogenesis protein MshK [Deltaproteobacteria bacterium]
MVNKLPLLCLLALLCGPVSAAETGRLQDPLRPVRYQAPAVEKKAEVERRSWSLSAVLLSADRAVAVINGQSLQLGDLLDGYRLVKIEPEKVLLRNNRKQVVLYRSGTGLKKISSFERVKKGSQP